MSEGFETSRSKVLDMYPTLWVEYECELKEAYYSGLDSLVTSILEEPWRRFKHRRLHRRVDRIESVLWAVRCVRHDIEEGKVTQIKSKKRVK